MALGQLPVPGSCLLPVQPGVPVCRSPGSCHVPCAAQREVAGRGTAGTMALWVGTAQVGRRYPHACPARRRCGDHGQAWHRDGGGDSCSFKVGQVGVCVPWTRALCFLLRRWHPAQVELPRVSWCPCGACGHTHRSPAGLVPGGCRSWARPAGCSGGSKSRPRRWTGTSFSFFPRAVQGHCSAGHPNAGPGACPGPGCLDSLPGLLRTLGQVEVLSRSLVPAGVLGLIVVWECSGGGRRG